MNVLPIWQDPQHGGTSTGCSYNGIIEKDYVVEIARDLQPALAPFAVNQRFSRKGDDSIPYDVRAQQAKEFGAKLAILHHVNAIVHPKDHPQAGEPIEHIDGLMTFCHPQDPIGYHVAEMIGRCAPKELRQKNPTYLSNNLDWKKRAHYCLQFYRAVRIPAVLIEWGFATSPKDSEILQDEDHRLAMCAAVVAGIGRAHEMIL